MRCTQLQVAARADTQWSDARIPWISQAALAAAQHGGGSYGRAPAPAMTPQVPRPPTSSALGLDLSSLRLATSSPTPAPVPQRVSAALQAESKISPFV